MIEKSFLFILNLAMFIGGCTIIGMVALALSDHVLLVGRILGFQFVAGSIYALLVGGLCVTLIAFLGCYGVWREVNLTILIYTAVVFVLYITLLVLGISAYIFKDQTFLNLKDQLRISPKEYVNDPALRSAWIDIQKYWKCCGVNGAFEENFMYPNLCCGSKKRLTVYCWLDKLKAGILVADYPGCLNKTKDFIEKHSNQIIISTISLAVVLCFCSLLAFALFLKIRRVENNRRKNYEKKTNVTLTKIS